MKHLIKGFRLVVEGKQKMRILKESPLYTQAWCDMVFEGRNRAYGAYVLRSRAGRRYRFALMVVGGIFVVLTSLLLLTMFLAGRAVNRVADEMQHVVRLAPLRDETERYVAAGRRAIPHATPDAVEEIPEVVDAPQPELQPAPIGIKGPDDGDFVPESSIVDRATDHSEADESLPVEGPQLIPTQAVEEMPVFPGGLKALIRFLDTHCVYSERAIRDKIEGDVEVSFIIDTEGRVVDPQITRRLHPILDAAVLQAVREMPRWKPGTMNGELTCTRITVPFHFQLR